MKQLTKSITRTHGIKKDYVDRSSEAATAAAVLKL